jgi:hypothetical protein
MRSVRPAGYPRTVSVLDRVAYISERHEFDEHGPVATGLFDCEIRNLEGEWLGEDTRLPMALPEAVAWGRERAAQVSVRIGDRFYAAGSLRGSGPALPESLRVQRRRPPGWEHLEL